MTEWRFDRYRTAYHEMWKHARYRPAAPSDGFGSIQLTDDELLDGQRLEIEARKYAKGFVAEDDAMEYIMGCPDGRGNRAFCYIIEAARAICGPRPELAEDLLRMALKELASEYPADSIARQKTFPG